MAKTRAIVKNCPKCSQNVAVASKSCKCGYSFFVTRRSTRASGTGSGGSVRGSTPAEPDKGADGDCDERRRTSRVRREKPNYYDSQEYEKKKKKKDRRGRPPANKVLISQKKELPKTANNKESTALRAKRRRMRKELEDGGGDLCAKLSLEKQELAAIILMEINRKNSSVFWCPS